MTPEERTHIPSYNTMRSSFIKTRNRNYPPCKSLIDLNGVLLNTILMSDEHKIKLQGISLIDGDCMYKGIVQDGDDSALIFLNPEVQQKASRHSNILIDGTFKTAPLDAMQILNMFREVDGVVSNVHNFRSW